MRKLVVLLAALAAVVGLAAPAAAVERYVSDTLTITGYVLLHEGNGGTQSLLCAIPVQPGVKSGVVDMTRGDYGCENDEARSLTLLNLGMMDIEVYDRSACHLLDNQLGSPRSYIRVGDVVRPLTVPAGPQSGRLTIPSFEATTPPVRGLPYEERYVSLNGRLDGKVSCLRWTRQFGLTVSPSF